jgi:ABC-type bacteriocin/lantibiotic exporter with double-glycine peptidase domain
VKEFVVYTLMRLLLLVATFAVVFGIWLAVADSVNLMWVLIIAFVVSGLASYFLLNRQRVALAQHVDDRASRAAARFDEARAKEDAD